MQHRTKKALAAGLTVLIVAFISYILSGRAQAETAECVPSEAWTETVEHPAVTHEETVTTFDHWQRYSWTGGPVDGAPAFPSEDWQPNVKGDPHDIGAVGPYFVSHGGSGKGDWFYLEAVTITETIEVVDEEAWTEFIEHDEVVCDDEPVDECVDPVTGEDLCVHEEPEPPVEKDPEVVDNEPNPNVEIPDEPGETVTYQSFDGNGKLIEQRVEKSIPDHIRQEGM